MRAGLALVSAHDKQALPVLIASLAELPFNTAREVEDNLARIAGEQGPTETLMADLANKAKVKTSWETWWKANGDKVDLARVDATPRQLGYTLICEGYIQFPGKMSRVGEIDSKGKVRWEITNLQYPMYAQMTGNDRVLIAEQQRNRVFEADLTGKVLWEKPVTQAFVCERTRAGITFVAGRNSIHLFDRAGKETLNKSIPSDTIMAAHIYRDGTMAYFTYQGQYTRIDSSGKELKTFRVPYNMNFGMNGAEVLPNDHVLIAVGNTNKISEYDPNGKIVWEVTLTNPGNATRLPNGNTLVTTWNNTRLAEVDRNGKVLSESKELALRPCARPAAEMAFACSPFLN